MKYRFIKQRLVPPVRSETNRKSTADIKLGFGSVPDGFWFGFGSVPDGFNLLRYCSLFVYFSLLLPFNRLKPSGTEPNRTKTVRNPTKTGKAGSKS